MYLVTVDQLKPTFLEDPIKAALPPVRSWPALCPDLHAPDPSPISPSAVIPARGSAKKGV